MTVGRAAALPARPRRTLGVCCAAHALHDGLSDLLYVLLPVLAESFGLSYGQVGLVRSAHRAALSLFQLPAGLLSERIGERDLLAAGTALAGAAFVLLAGASTFPLVLVALFVAGCGSAVQHPLGASLVTDAYGPAHRRAAVGTYNFAGDVGKFAFAGATGLLLASGVEWQTAVSLYAGVAMVGAVAIFIALAGRGVPRRPTGPMPPPARGWGIRSPRGFAALLAMAVLDGSARAGFLVFAAFVLIEKGVAPATAALAVPMVLVGGMLGKLACGFAAQRFGVFPVVVLTEFGTAAGVLAVLAVSPAAAFVLLPVVGVALSGTSSVVYGSIGDLVDGGRHARAFGVLYSVQAAAGLAAPVGFGLIADAHGLDLALAAAAGAALAVVPFAWVLRPALIRR